MRLLRVLGPAVVGRGAAPDVGMVGAVTPWAGSRSRRTSARRGPRIVICRNGEPVADLVPHQREVSMAAGKKLGAIKVNYDPTEEASEADWPPEAR